MQSVSGANSKRPGIFYPLTANGKHLNQRLFCTLLIIQDLPESCKKKQLSRFPEVSGQTQEEAIQAESWNRVLFLGKLPPVDLSRWCLDENRRRNGSGSRLWSRGSGALR